MSSLKNVFGTHFSLASVRCPDSILGVKKEVPTAKEV